MDKINSYVAHHKQFIIDSFNSSRPYCAVVQALAKGKDAFQIGIYVMDEKQEVGRLKSINDRQGPIKDIELWFSDEEIDFTLKTQRRQLEEILENPQAVKDQLDSGLAGAMEVFYQHKNAFIPGRTKDYTTFIGVLFGIPSIFRSIFNT